MSKKKEKVKVVLDRTVSVAIKLDKIDGDCLATVKMCGDCGVSIDFDDDPACGLAGNWHAPDVVIAVLEKAVNVIKDEFKGR